MRRPRHVAAVLLGAIAAGVQLTGCSQVEQLKPVGSRVTLVRFAALDVLAAKNVELLVAPVCTSTDDNVSCTGQTVSQQPITVTSIHDNPVNMDIAVGGSVVYSGSIQAVLDAQARPTS